MELRGELICLRGAVGLDFEDDVWAYDRARTSGMARNPAYFRGGSRKRIFSHFSSYSKDLHGLRRPESVARAGTSSAWGWGFAETGVQLFEK